MDYDGLSSPGSHQSDPVSKESFMEGGRFVILWHSMPPLKVDRSSQPTGTFPLKPAECRSSHFDLMLESNERLSTFELSKLPIPGERFPILKLADHRIEYLEYEGPISNNRGHVTRWTSGTFVTALDSVEKWIVELVSPRLSARLVLIRPNSDTIEERDRWHLRASRWQLRPPR